LQLAPALRLHWAARRTAAKVRWASRSLVREDLGGRRARQAGRDRLSGL